MNHRIAKAMAEPGFLIGKEVLTDTRVRTTVQGAKNRRKQSQSAFAELGTFVANVQQAGDLAITVDADYTFQACCGHVSQRTRFHHGLTFVCQCGGVTLHAGVRCGRGPQCHAQNASDSLGLDRNGALVNSLRWVE